MSEQVELQVGYPGSGEQKITPSVTLRRSCDVVSLFTEDGDKDLTHVTLTADQAESMAGHLQRFAGELRQRSQSQPESTHARELNESCPCDKAPEPTLPPGVMIVSKPDANGEITVTFTADGVRSSRNAVGKFKPSKQFANATAVMVAESILHAMAGSFASKPAA